MPGMKRGLARFTSLFSFEDLVMEHRFRQYFRNTNLDRAKPVIYYFWMVGVMRAMWLIYVLAFPNSVSEFDWGFAVLHGSIIIIAVLLVQTKWSDSSKVRAGIANLWIVRVSSVVVLTQQLGVNHGDPQVMVALIGYLCLGGLSIPSYAEYLLIVLPLAFARPLLLGLSLSSDPDLLHQSLFQHSLILALGASITATIHADCRRNWLRSASSSAGFQQPARRNRGSAQPTDPSRADNEGSDERDAECFAGPDEQHAAQEVTAVCTAT
jgi:hypothetical protein